MELTDTEKRLLNFVRSADDPAKALETVAQIISDFLSEQKAEALQASVEAATE